MQPSEEGLVKGVTYTYPVFPEKFDTKFYYQPRKIHDYRQNNTHKALVTNQMIMNMHDQDWAKYMCETVYVLWLQVFCGVLPAYGKYTGELVLFARKLV